MTRNLDVAALRALVAIEEMGGVTRAAVQMGLTQSAVSLQIKRLEEAFARPLIARRGRGVALTPEGEGLLVYARRIVAMNDEIVQRMTAADDDAGWLRVGMPCDLMHMHVPEAIRAFTKRHPGVRVTFRAELSVDLRALIDAGALDLVMTTEAAPGPGAETLRLLPLVWVGAPGGRAWRRRPLPLAAVAGCAFNEPTFAALSRAGATWDMAGEAASKVAVDGAVAADTAVTTMLGDSVPGVFEVIDSGGALPALPAFGVNLYLTRGPRRRLAEPLADLLRAAFAADGEIAAA